MQSVSGPTQWRSQDGGPDAGRDPAGPGGDGVASGGGELAGSPGRLPGQKKPGPGGHSPHESTSALLLRAVEGERNKVSIAEIVDALDARAFGLAVLMFALPSCLPMPPGVPTVVGVVLLIVSVQMVMFRKELWLPRVLSAREFPRQPLINGLKKFQPRLQALERVARPRLLFLSGRIGTFLIGVVVLLLATVLVLPLPPGGNFPPALACAILGMGLAERDGVIILVGFLTCIVAVAVSYIVTIAAIDLLRVSMGW
jgi:hypothetical protein